MTTVATSEADEAWLKKPRRLHWMALFYPFRSYARPQRLGGAGALPWLIVALLLGIETLFLASFVALADRFA